MNSLKLRILAAGLLALMLFPPMVLTDKGMYSMAIRAGSEGRMDLLNAWAGGDRLVSVQHHFLFGEHAQFSSIQVGHLLVIGLAWSLAVWLVSSFLPKAKSPVTNSDSVADPPAQDTAQTGAGSSPGTIPSR